MAGVTTRSGIESMLKAMVSGSGAVAWDDWLPLMGIAVATPPDWIGAVQSLSTEQQYLLLDLLRRDDAGPFADGLLVVTARYAQEIEDSQVRDFLLSDAHAASDRRLALMAQQRDHMSELVETMEARQSEAFDLAQEMGLLERRLQDLRLEEIDTEYERVHAIEREIMRLETFRDSLKAYDPVAREALRVELAAETESLRQRRDLLEQQIEMAIGDRDASRRDAADADERLALLQREEEELRTGVAAATATIATATGVVNQLRTEQVTLSQQVAELERHRAQLEQSTQDDARRVLELRDSPAAQRYEQLSEALARVWPLLPEDQAERQFLN